MTRPIAAAAKFETEAPRGFKCYIISENHLETAKNESHVFANIHWQDAAIKDDALSAEALVDTLQILH